MPKTKTTTPYQQGRATRKGPRPFVGNPYKWNDEPAHSAWFKGWMDEDKRIVKGSAAPVRV